MSNLINGETCFPQDNCGFIKISFDQEMMKDWENEFHQDCIALKNEEFGFGVWMAEDNTAGVYGNSILSKMAISHYWDQNADEIEQALQNAKTIEEVIDVANSVIIGTILNILPVAHEDTAC